MTQQSLATGPASSHILPSARTRDAGPVLCVHRERSAPEPESVVAVLTVKGEVDIATVEPLRAAALSAAHTRPGQAVVVVLDLEAVTFMDSSAVRFLADFHAQSAERGWTVEVLAPVRAAPAELLRLAVEREWVPADLVQRDRLRARRGVAVGARDGAVTRWAVTYPPGADDGAAAPATTSLPNT